MYFLIYIVLNNTIVIVNWNKLKLLPGTNNFLLFTSLIMYLKLSGLKRDTNNNLYAILEIYIMGLLYSLVIRL